METFLDIIMFALLSGNLISNICMSKKIKVMEANNERLHMNLIPTFHNLSASIDEIELKTIKMSGQIDGIQNEMHRSLLDLRSLLDAAKPIKSNNWDSVRAAFKGPVRTNERD